MLHGIRGVIFDIDGVLEYQGKAYAGAIDAVETLVVGDYRSMFDFDRLNHALRLLLRGAKLVGMSPDLVDNSAGAPELNVGSWVRLLEVASGVQAVYVGKPQSFVFELALADMGLSKDQVVMVGDRIQSDIRGAQTFGIESVLVKTGEFRVGDLDAGIKPDFILDSITDLMGLLAANTESGAIPPHSVAVEFRSNV